MDIYAILGLIAAAIALIWLGETKKSTKSSASFHIENKKVPLHRVVFGIFSVVGAGEFVYMTELSYSYGLASSILFFGFALGALLFAYFFSDRLRRHHPLAETNAGFDVFSTPDLAYIQNGPLVSRIVSVLAIITLGALLMIQFYLGGKIIGILTNLPYALSVFLLAATVGIYVIRGGFGSILFTDIIQVVVLFVVFALLAIMLPSPESSSQSILSTFTIPDSSHLSLLIVGGICWVLGGSDIWQRITAAESDATAKRALYVSSFLLAIFGLLIAYVGVQTVQLLPIGETVDTQNGQVLKVTEVNSFEALLWSLDDWLKYVVALGLFAGFVSTADTEVHAISTIISKERFRGTQPDTQWTKWCILIVTGIAFIASLALQEHINTAYLVLLNVFIIVGGFMLPTLLGYGRTLPSAIGLLISIVAFFVLFHTNNLSGYYASMLFIPPMVLGFIGGKKHPYLEKIHE